LPGNAEERQIITGSIPESTLFLNGIYQFNNKKTGIFYRLVSGIAKNGLNRRAYF